MASNPLLHVCAPLLPDYDAVVKERNQDVETVTSLLVKGIEERDEQKFARGMKRAEQLLDGLACLTVQETTALLTPLCDVGLQTEWSWVSIWTSGKALKLTTRLTSGKNLAIKPYLQDILSWKRLLNCAQIVHGFPDKGSECRHASDDALRQHAEQLGYLCRRARMYQAPGTAAAVCDALEPQVITADREDERMQEAQVYLFMVYPGGNANDDADPNGRLKKWMDAWGQMDNSMEWDAAWFGLVKRLVRTRKADVSPYLSRLFGRAHSSLRLGNQLPQDQVAPQRYYSAWQGALSRTTGSVKAAKLIIEILHVGDVMKRLEHLMMTVRTFIHPSNQGSHAERLSTFIGALCEGFAKRIGRDSKAGDMSLSRECKLRFIDSLFPLIIMGLNSKSLSVISTSQGALRHLAWVAPVTVAKRTMSDLVSSGLDPANTRSHQTTAALKALTVMIQPLIYGGVASRRILVPLLPVFLEQSLPGIDPNDTRKTAVTMMMAYAVLSCVPLVNTAVLKRSNKANQTNCADAFGIDEVYVEMEGLDGQRPDDLWSYGPMLADWGLAYLRRLFTLAQARGARAKKGMSAQLDVILDYFFFETATLCLSQMDPTTRARAMKEICSFLVEEGARPDAHSEAQALARACARADADLALKTMLPALMLMVDDKGDTRSVSWALVALGGLVRDAGDDLLPYSAELEKTIQRSFAHKEAAVRKLGEKLVRRYARALLDTYLVRDAHEQDAQLIRDIEGNWANFEGDWKNMKVKWHTPSHAGISRATGFLTELKDKALEGILGIEQDKADFHPELTDKQRRHHRLSLLHQIIRGSLTHLDSSQAGSLSRSVLIDKMIEISTNLQPTTDTDGIKLVVKCLSLLGSGAQGPRGAGHGEWVRAYSMWSAWLREISQSKAHESGVRMQYRLDYLQKGVGTGEVPELLDRVEPRHVMETLVETLYKKRKYNASFGVAQSVRGNEELEAPYRKAGDALQELCFHPFSSVRIAAQRHRGYVDTRFGWIARERLMESTLPRLGVMCRGKPENFTGALYVCGGDSSVAKISRRWSIFQRFFEIIVKDSAKAIDSLPAHRQAKAQERLAKLLHVSLQKWHQFPKSSVPKGELGQLLMTLSVAGNDPSVHWRRKIVLCSAVGVLLDPLFENEIPRETIYFVVNSARCEILPLRTVALAVMRRMMLCGESVCTLLAHELSKNTADFWLLAGATLAEDRSSAAAEDQHADWSVGVGEFIKLVRGLVKRHRFPRSRYESAAPKDFHSPKADFWSALCTLTAHANPETLETIALPTLKKLAFEGDSNKDRIIRRMSACELFAGCLSVKPEWTKAFFPVLARMLAELPSATNWCDGVLYVASFSSDRASSLLTLLDNETDRIGKFGSSVTGGGTDVDMEPETESEREQGFAYTSNLLKVMWSLLSARPDPVPSPILNKFERALLHPYKQVRQSASTALAGFVIVGLYSNSAARDAILHASTKNKEGLEAGLDFLALLCGIGDSQKILEPLITPILGPTLFQGQGHDDMDLAKMAKNFINITATIKCFSVPDQAITLEQRLCTEFVASPDWPKRRALAQFLRLFHAHHTCLLLGMGAGALVQKTAEDLLLDAQAEVREAARALLLGLLAAANPTSLTSARDRYFKMINRPESIKKRQGILALMALVEACPYSVPEAIPLSVLELSRHVNGANGVLVKKTLSEFRRTHIDEWAEHKKAFTDDQLNELEGVLVSPDYYA